MLTQSQINTIIAEIKEIKEVQGILLTGSYVYGKPTDKSDLDIRMITTNFSKDDRNWVKFSTRIEAFYNTPDEVKKYFRIAWETGDEPVVDFWKKGKIVYDPNGIVMQLQNEANALWEKGPKSGKWKTRDEYVDKMKSIK